MCMCVLVCECVLLTQSGVVEGEVPQVAGVLRQGKQPPRVAVPHQAAPGSVFQNSVLDDLQHRKGVEGEINHTGNVKNWPLKNLLTCTDENVVWGKRRESPPTSCRFSTKFVSVNFKSFLISSQHLKKFAWHFARKRVAFAHQTGLLTSCSGISEKHTSFLGF